MTDFLELLMTLRQAFPTSGTLLTISTACIVLTLQLRSRMQKQKLKIDTAVSRCRQQVAGKRHA